MTVAVPGDGTDEIIEKARAEGRLVRVTPENYEEIIESMAKESGLVGEIVGSKKPRKRTAPATGEGNEPEVVDIGPYCVSCREDTTGQEKRTEDIKQSLKVTGNVDAEGEPEVIDVQLKGWLCEDCQPFQSDLIEATFVALVERRYDPVAVRKAMRAIGEEKFWVAFEEPMLMSIEVALGLEPK